MLSQERLDNLKKARDSRAVNVYKPPQEVFDVVNQISEIKNASDDVRESAYSWTVRSNHDVKIHTLLDNLKKLEKKIRRAAETLNVKITA